jgi:Tfp pilus assembly protein PilF
VIEFFNAAVKLRRGREVALLFEEFGVYLLQMKEYIAAKKAFQDAVDHPALDGLKPHFLSRLSQAQEGNGETEAALATIADARKRGDSSRLQFQEAWIFYHSRKWDEAIQRFEQIIDAFRQSQNPQDLEVVRRSRFSLSSVYVQRGDLRKGEEILEQILAETPDDVSVNNDLGYLWADQGKNLDRAEKMIRKAVAAEPDNAAYLDSLGWVLFKLGKHEEALPHLEKAANMPEGGDATIWDHLGDCFDRLKKHDLAKQAWEKALKQSQDEPQPDEKLLKQIQEKLKNAPPGAASLRPEKPDAP